MTQSFITPGHVRAFQAVTTHLYGETTLASCLVNGEPGVAIVLAEHVGEGKIGVLPLFVAITPGMKLQFVGEGDSEGGGGGPKRSTEEEFSASARTATGPQPS